MPRTSLRTLMPSALSMVSPSSVTTVYSMRGTSESIVYLKTRMRAWAGPPDPTYVTARARASRRRLTERAWALPDSKLLPAAHHIGRSAVTDGCDWLGRGYLWEFPSCAQRLVHLPKGSGARTRSHKVADAHRLACRSVSEVQMKSFQLCNEPVRIGH
jgi:hypothetical protein